MKTLLRFPPLSKLSTRAFDQIPNDVWMRVFQNVQDDPLVPEGHSTALLALMTTSKHFFNIAGLLFWKVCYVSDAQASPLASLTSDRRPNRVVASLETITRGLCFTGGPSQSAAVQESVLDIFELVNCLRVLHIHCVMANTSFLGFIHSVHANTLQDLHIRVPYFHNATTSILERFSNLRKLFIVLDGSGNTKANFAGRALGDGHSFQQLTFFGVEVITTSTLIQQTDMLRLVARSRFPYLSHTSFVINGDGESNVDFAIEKILDFLNGHDQTLQSVTLEVVPTALEAILNDIDIPTVHVHAYDGIVAIGAVMSPHVRHISVGGYGDNGMDGAFSYAMACMLYAILGRVFLGRFRQAEMALEVIQLDDFSWPSPVPLVWDEYALAVSYLAHALLSLKVHVIDDAGYNIEGRYVRVQV